MKFRYTVHSAHNSEVPVSAKTLDGREVQAMVPALIVELVPEGEHRHTVTLDVVAPSAAEHDAAIAEFAVGSVITLTATKE